MPALRGSDPGGVRSKVPDRSGTEDNKPTPEDGQARQGQIALKRTATYAHSGESEEYWEARGKRITGEEILAPLFAFVQVLTDERASLAQKRLYYKSKITSMSDFFLSLIKRRRADHDKRFKQQRGVGALRGNTSPAMPVLRGSDPGGVRSKVPDRSGTEDNKPTPEDGQARQGQIALKKTATYV
ncbi:hypothetical protein NDU88_001070 [Pleurodeles waltl]|uniref:Uncharacterized protein n=1 Tax=Pleurodeles waltl TaxID=8319 RepID=A0AAV7V6V2_PLEWA|nr:hypothetical protein NDU88_001070 [Pleurodeles waltl]